MKNAICIEHGDTTCAVEPGKFCLFLGAKFLGTKPVCMLFDNEPLYDVDEGEFKGWLGRCDTCLRIFTGDVVITKEFLK